jgi:mycothiol system anti-sigma-R factor
MSCGKPHEVPCSEILERLYDYLDNEMGDMDCAKFRQHLEECGPCLDKYGLERIVKALIRRSCGCDEVPGELRGKVISRIAQVRIEMISLEQTSSGPLAE